MHPSSTVIAAAKVTLIVFVGVATSAISSRFGEYPSLCSLIGAVLRGRRTAESHLAVHFIIENGRRTAAVPHVHQGWQAYGAVGRCSCSWMKMISVVPTRAMDTLRECTGFRCDSVLESSNPNIHDRCLPQTNLTEPGHECKASLHINCGSAALIRSHHLVAITSLLCLAMDLYSRWSGSIAAFASCMWCTYHAENANPFKRLVT